jgi:hypothetical protein
VEIADDGSPDVKSSKYAIAEYSSRLEHPDQMNSIASNLLSEVAAKLSVEYKSDVHEMDPLAANILNLSDSVIAHQVCTILRNSEIISNKRLSYRELWGATSIAFLGNLPSLVPASQIATYVQRFQPQGLDAVKDFKNAAKLADLRFTQALFGVKFGEHPKSHVANEIQDFRHSLALVDPFRDSQPGQLGGARIPKRGWATPLHDAFTGAFAALSPLKALQKNVGDSYVMSIVSDFDRKLDDLFVGAMQSDQLKAAGRSELIAWYSGYLTRLYAVAQGLSAFADTFIEWTKLWNLEPMIPSNLKEQILTLLRPPRVPNLNKASLIPLFDSRTLPIQGEIAHSKLSLMVNDLEVKTQASGNNLFLLLKESEKQSARILLDFPLFREISACASGHTGVTEQTSISAPRLERIRSSNLIPASQAKIGQYVIATETGEAEFQIRPQHD